MLSGIDSFNALRHVFVGKHRVVLDNTNSCLVTENEFKHDRNTKVNSYPALCLLSATSVIEDSWFNLFRGKHDLFIISWVMNFYCPLYVGRRLSSCFRHRRFTCFLLVCYCSDAKTNYAAFRFNDIFWIYTDPLYDLHEHNLYNIILIHQLFLICIQF